MNKVQTRFRRDQSLKPFYLFLSFFSGVVVMLVEIAGVRLLSPLFGNSIYTWTALIAVVLFALSFGNVIGGWLADRSGAVSALNAALAISAITTLLLPTMALLLRPDVAGLGPVYGPLIFSTVLFVIPAAAFGMISPIALRLMSRMTNDKHVGMVGGLINSSSAIGSVAGTLLTGFVLMRYMGINDIYYLTALLLLIVCGVSMLLHRKMPGTVSMAAGSVLVVFATVMAYAVQLVPNPGLLEKQLSYYQELEVIEEKQDDGLVVRRMLHDNFLQGSIEIVGRNMTREFQRIWRLLELQRDKFEPEDILVVGGGTFGVPQQFRQRWEDSSITVLEIDQTVIDAARKWFYLDEFPDIDVRTVDARLYLNQSNDTYDLVYVDVFGGLYSIPAHLTTQEFFLSIKEKLESGGMGMINIIAAIDEPKSAVFDAMYATISSVFDNVQVYDSKHKYDSGISNVYMVFGDTLPDVDKLVPIDDET